MHEKLLRQFAFHLTPAKNLPSILERGLWPMIGPRSAALGEAFPMIYFLDSLEAVEDALMNWAGDAFGNEERLALLAVNKAWINRVEIDDQPDWERASAERIDPRKIAVVTENLDDVPDLQSAFSMAILAPKVVQESISDASEMRP